MNSDASKIIAMVCGQNRNDFDVDSISPTDRNQIDNALDSVFVGKSTLIWLRGGKLVDAWNTALTDLRDEMFAIPNTNPAVTYLRMAVFNHRTKWNLKMMQSNERNSVAFMGTDFEKQEIIDNANAMIKAGYKTIKQIINASTGSQHIQPSAKQLEQTMAYQNERVRDREHGRERKR